MPKYYIKAKVIIAEPSIKDGREGYAITYEDGYQSWSPKAAFESSYRGIEGLTFGEALEALRIGKKVARKGWNGKGLWLELQTPDAKSKMTLPYIFMSYPADAPNTPGARVPWLASQTDMLSSDWGLVL